MKVTHEHRRDQKVVAGFAVLIVSDSRTKDTDESGKIANDLIEHAGHHIKAYDIVKNDATQIKDMLKKYTENRDIRIIVTSGGTGVSSRDKTVNTVTPMIQQILPGFGEYFRRLSFEEVGVAGINSRAVAGIINKQVIYCLPGSKNAVRTALTKIILPGIGHLLWEIDR
jgi:molybdenum cofactor biosynthesis protein B